MTDLILPSRRGLILGLGASLVCAPAVVRAASLMPVKVIKPQVWFCADYSIVEDRMVAITFTKENGVLHILKQEELHRPIGFPTGLLIKLPY